MTIEEAIKAFLSADAGVTAACAGRIWDEETPQEPTYPAVAFWRVSGAREYAMQGPSGLAHPVFQFDCSSGKKSEAKLLADAVRAAFDGFPAPGIMGGASGVRVDAAFAGDERKGTFYEGTQLVRCVQLDVEIWHAE